MNLFHEDRQQRTDDAWRDHDRRQMNLARFAVPDFWEQVQGAAAAPSPLAAPAPLPVKQVLAETDRLLAELDAVQAAPIPTAEQRHAAAFAELVARHPQRDFYRGEVPGSLL